MDVRNNLRGGVVWQPARRRLLVFLPYNTVVCLLYGPLNVHVPQETKLLPKSQRCKTCGIKPRTR